jgi:hypothetical protein
MYKKGDIVKSTFNNERFYLYCDQIDNLEVTLLYYDNPDKMILGYVCFLTLDVEFSRKLKLKKLLDEIRKTKGTHS